MRCDDVLAQAAELGGTASPEVRAHLEACAACRAAVEDARDGAAAVAAFERDGGADALGPADAGAAWRAAAPGAGAARPWAPRVLRSAGRVAAAVLAVVGASALLGVRVEASERGTSVVLPVPFAPPAVPAAARDDAALVRALRDDLVTRLDAAEARRAAAEAERLERLTRTMSERAARDDADFEALVGEIVALRRELEVVRFQTSAPRDVAGAMPPLPDPD